MFKKTNSVNFIYENFLALVIHEFTMIIKAYWLVHKICVQQGHFMNNSSTWYSPELFHIDVIINQAEFI